MKPYENFCSFSKIIIDAFPPWQWVNTHSLLCMLVCMLQTSKLAKLVFLYRYSHLLFINESSVFDYQHLAVSFPLDSDGSRKVVLNLYSIVILA